MKKSLTRRHFLKVAGAGMAGAALIGGAGCGGTPEMNVVLIIIDSLRKDHVGAYGNSWIKTPSLDAFARESYTIRTGDPLLPLRTEAAKYRRPGRIRMV